MTDNDDRLRDVPGDEEPDAVEDRLDRESVRNVAPPEERISLDELRTRIESQEGRGVKTYRVECFEEGDLWPVRVFDVDGQTQYTQGLDFEDVSVMARDLIALILEQPEDSFEIDVTVVEPWSFDD